MLPEVPAAGRHFPLEDCHDAVPDARYAPGNRANRWNVHRHLVLIVDVPKELAYRR